MVTEENRRPLMSEEEFEKYVKDNMYNSNGSLKLFINSYIATGKFKSVRRAIKRGHMSMLGVIYPKRPFNNRGTKDSLLKQKIYGVLNSRQQQV